MPELRQNLATKEWVVISPERGQRPDDFKTKKEKKVLPPQLETCPFCPGNEDKTPYETFVIHDAAGKWKVRCIPNKYPALSSEGTLERKIDGIKRSVSGVGICEVIIESPLHNAKFATMPETDIREVLQAYKVRYKYVSEDARTKLVIIFRNYGSLAGASVEHPHSQLIATPVVPFHIRYRLEEAMRYFDETGECVFCKMLQEEIKLKERIVVETGSFVSFVPYAALSPFHIWILPRRHMALFDEIDDSELADLAKNLKTTLAKIYYGLDDPDYNYVIRTAPCGDKEIEYYHWYISIVLKLTKPAGFELGSGMSINVCLPEDNAKFLREIKTR